MTNSIKNNLAMTKNNLAMSSPLILSNLRIGPHNFNILEIIIGSLLGDGTMERKENSLACNFAFYQEKIHGEYLLWLHREITALGYCKEEIPQIQSRKGISDTHEVRYTFRFRTFTYTSFYWIYEGFYNNSEKRRKIIPEWIKDYLSPRALAIWIMDDGTYLKNKGLRFSTNSFTLSEVKYLGSILESKYGLSFTLHKTGVVNQYALYIPKKNMPLLIEIVKPHIHPTMLYKLGL